MNTIENPMMEMTYPNNYHGVALEIYGSGVFIYGKCGVGKSDLALSLINRKHKFIGDDYISIKIVDDTLYLEGVSTFMNIRGVGFVDIKNTHGLKSIIKASKLNLIIELSTDDICYNKDSLNQQKTLTNILGYEICQFKLHVNNRKYILPDLIEIIVKYWQCCNDGYDSHQIFIQNQDEKICNLS